MSYTILSLYTDELTEEFKSHYIQFHQKMTQYHFPRDPLVQSESFQFEINNTFRSLRTLIIDKETPIALAFTSMQRNELKTLNVFLFEIDPNYYGKGIELILMRHLASRFLDTDAKTLQINIRSPESCKEFDELGSGKMVGKMEINRLYLEDVNWEEMKLWVNEAESKNPGTQFLILKDGIPEAYLARYVESINMMREFAQFDGVDYGMSYSEKDIRNMETDNKKNDIVHYTGVTIEQDERLSGFTDIYYLPKQTPLQIGQQGTLVLPHFRRRGLAKWLKAKILLEISKDFPDVKYIQTQNQNVNAAILKLNYRIGYRKIKEIQLYGFNRSEAEQFVNSR